MKLPRDLSGAKLSRHLCKKWGYVEVNQTGSHLILETKEPSAQRISVPVHKALIIGTNIYRKSVRCTAPTLGDLAVIQSL